MWPGALGDVGTAHHDFDAAPEAGELAREILHMPLDAALHIREAAQPEHGDARAGLRFARYLAGTRDYVHAKTGSSDA
jgi:hypothetical protein